MSVNFTVEANPTGQYTFTCYAYETHPDSPFRSEAYPSREACQAAATAHTAATEACGWEPALLLPVYDVHETMNVSNVHASMLLSIVGIDTSEDLCGSLEGEDLEDLVARLLLSLVEQRDSAAVAAVEMPRPLDEHGQPVGARVIDCGLPAGYVPDRLARMADIASTALRLGRAFQWG